MLPGVGGGELLGGILRTSRQREKAAKRRDPFSGSPSSSLGIHFHEAPLRGSASSRRIAGGEAELLRKGACPSRSLGTSDVEA